MLLLCDEGFNYFFNKILMLIALVGNLGKVPINLEYLDIVQALIIVSLLLTFLLKITSKFHLILKELYAHL